MKTYRVHLKSGAFISITVEADDADGAIEKAFEEMPGDVCAQCGGWGQNWTRELGDEWQEYEVTEDQSGKVAWSAEKGYAP